VDDDAEAIEAIIGTPIERIAGEVLNVATGTDISVSEIADRVLDALGKPRDLQTHVLERLGQVDRHIGSTEKTARLTGWRARTSFDEGLERTIRWYRENEAWWRPVAATPRSVSSS
jgi:dTDP-glucose 4,6-dehydratase